MQTRPSDPPTEARGGQAEQAVISDGTATLPEAPGIGLEARAAVLDLLRSHLGG